MNESKPNSGWNESKPTSGWNESKPSFPITMNVGEAMAYASKDKCFWTGEMHTALETLAAEVERLRAEVKILAVEVTRLQAIEHEQIETQAELAQLRKDWCDDDEAIKQQALRVLDVAKVEGDSVYVPRMGALAEMMADEIERLRIWNKRWRDVSARLRLTLAELISEELKQGKHYET